MFETKLRRYYFAPAFIFVIGAVGLVALWMGFGDLTQYVNYRRIKAAPVAVTGRVVHILEGQQRTKATVEFESGGQKFVIKREVYNLYGYEEGSEIQIEVSLSPIGTGDTAVAAASIRDVSKRIAHEKELENALDDLSDLRSQLEAENLYLKQEAGRYQGFEEIVGLFQQLNERNITVVSMRNKTNRLEELFMRLVENNQSDAAKGES